MWWLASRETRYEDGKNATCTLHLLEAEENATNRSTKCNTHTSGSRGRQYLPYRQTNKSTFTPMMRAQKATSTPTAAATNNIRQKNSKYLLNITFTQVSDMYLSVNDKIRYYTI